MGCEEDTVGGLFSSGGKILHLGPGDGNPDFGLCRLTTGLVKSLDPLEFIGGNGRQGKDGEQNQKI